MRSVVTWRLNPLAAGRRTAMVSALSNLKMSPELLVKAFDNGMALLKSVSVFNWLLVGSIFPSLILSEQLSAGLAST